MQSVLCSSSILLPSISIFIFISIQFQTSFCANNTRYTNCSQVFNCGALENISYPFWGLNRPDYCGQPGFHLECQDDIPKIKMLQNTFRVLGVSPGQQTIKLTRDDYWDGICPTELINTTIDFNHFSYVPGLWNLTLFYNCSSSDNSNSYSYSPSPQPLSCTIKSSTINLSYSFDPIASSNSVLLGECVSNVRIPINETAAMILYQNPALVNDTVKAGFDLKWEISNQCENCLNSGGACGYNVTTTFFTCFCQNNQSWPNTCPSKPASTNKTKLYTGLGIAGAAIVGILLGGWCLFAIQRRRRRNEVQSKSKDLLPPPSSTGLTTTTTSTNRSRSIPSYSSSDIEKGSTYFGVQVFTYTELQEATDNFDPSKELGDGGFGTVYYGVLNDGRIVAVKRLYENNLKRVEQFKNEIKILADIHHPNLVTLYGCTSRHSRELLLVYEYIPNGTVADHLHGRRARSCTLPWPIRLNIAIETAKALVYLHSRDIIHRDVKTNNILLDNNFRVKVADFGLSRLFPNDVTHVSTAPQGTPGYVDPEYYQCYHLTEKSDVYSFGVVLAELISAKQAVDVTRHRYDINLASMVVSRIQNGALSELVDPSLDFETDISVRKMVTSMAELAFQCLQQERKMRPSMEEVLEVLMGMNDRELGGEAPEVVDIGGDDVGLLRHIPPPLSPDSGAASDKWVHIRTM